MERQKPVLDLDLDAKISKFRGKLFEYFSLPGGELHIPQEVFRKVM
jgi:hypothetical protein